MSSEKDKARERARYASLSLDEKHAKGLAANERAKARRDALKAENEALRSASVGLERRKTYGGDELLSFVPFRMWLLQKQKDYGGSSALAKAIGYDEAIVRRWLQGYVWESRSTRWCGPTPILSITFRVVDEVLTREGTTSMGALYP